MVLNKIIRKEAGHKSVYFNNCPSDLCLYLCLDLERFYIDEFLLEKILYRSLQIIIFRFKQLYRILVC